MPTNQPSNAPTNGAGDIPATDARDDDTAAAALADERLDTTPGGGGLGGAAAADPLGGSQRAPAGTAPNSPIDLGVSAGDAGGRDERHQAAEADRGSSTLPSP